MITHSGDERSRIELRQGHHGAANRIVKSRASSPWRRISCCDVRIVLAKFLKRGIMIRDHSFEEVGKLSVPCSWSTKETQD